MMGKVYLVGAGPGDPGLITLKAVECLKKAEVVVYDHLLDNALLELAPSKAAKIYAGKSGNHHAMEQDEINRLLVEKAAEGKTVVRLKGGDPFVLGRGGEEAEALTGHGIPFEIVPGITSAIAVPAYAGIPVTHRGVASSFAVVTGHEDPTKETSSVNWEKLATAVDTLVFLMGVKNLDKIVARLVEHGRSPTTPVAVIQNGTRAGQKTVTGILENIVEKVRESDISAPAITIVGEVVRLREKLRWFDNRPLSGKKVLVTRARHQASALSSLLSERGAVPIELAAIDIRASDGVELDRALESLADFNWLIFTSVNGVEVFFNRLTDMKRDARSLSGIKIGAIGPATADTLKLRGIIPDFVPAVFTTKGIIEGLKEYQLTGKKFLLPRADIADEELAGGLKEMGAFVDAVAVYTTKPAVEAIARAKEIISQGGIDIITFTSSSTVTNLMNNLNGQSIKLNGAVIACIGPKTAETATRLGLKPDIIAAESTIPGLVRAIENYFTEAR
ncbi:MAG: uroporphyrinogen-III C-methyltransferase [Dehalococcoidia bacterium]|nr:uroporphyrinogen-III C-methyltransferase [Dehalococcoidia bacterium]